MTKADSINKGITIPAKEVPKVDRKDIRKKYKRTFAKRSPPRYNTEKEIAVETTLNIGKEILKHNVRYGHEAGRAIRFIKRWARKYLCVSDVRLRPEVNEAVWSRGNDNPPCRLRLRFVRTINQEEGRQGKLVTTVYHVPVTDFSELITKVETGASAAQDE